MIKLQTHGTHILTPKITIFPKTKKNVKNYRLQHMSVKKIASGISNESINKKSVHGPTHKSRHVSRNVE